RLGVGSGTGGTDGSGTGRLGSGTGSGPPPVDGWAAGVAPGAAGAEGAGADVPPAGAPPAEVGAGAAPFAGRRPGSGVGDAGVGVAAGFWCRRPDRTAGTSSGLAAWVPDRTRTRISTADAAATATRAARCERLAGGTNRSGRRRGWRASRRARTSLA